MKEKTDSNTNQKTQQAALEEHRRIIPKNDWKSSQDKASNGCWLSALERGTTHT